MKPVEGGVSVHLACQARAQNMGPKAAEMLKLLPQTKVEVVERCSGHGGTFGVLNPTQYGKERAERRKALLPMKRLRRVEVGPHATFYFENYDTRERGAGGRCSPMMPAHVAFRRTA